MRTYDEAKPCASTFQASRSKSRPRDAVVGPVSRGLSPCAGLARGQRSAPARAAQGLIRIGFSMGGWSSSPRRPARMSFDSMSG